MNDQWFVYAGEDLVDGPYSEEDLRKRLTAGSLTAESYIRRGEEPWAAVAEALPPAEAAAEIEVAVEQPEVAEEAEYAISTDGETAARFAGAPKRSSTLPARRSKNAWTKNKNVMLIAAIVLGGVAAIIVGKLVLWLIRPTPKPDPYGYGARPAQTVPADRSATA